MSFDMTGGGEQEMNLQEEVENVLGKAEYFKYSRNKGCLKIEYGCMYEAPLLNFSVLKKLSELFGTDNIDVDDYAYGGCDTCDYGSNYGHEIAIREATKNVEEFKKLKNKKR
jgi:hypothetical protein